MFSREFCKTFKNICECWRFYLSYGSFGDCLSVEKVFIPWCLLNKHKKCIPLGDFSKTLGLSETIRTFKLMNEENATYSSNALNFWNLAVIMSSKFPSYLYQRKRNMNVTFTQEFFAFVNSDWTLFLERSYIFFDNQSPYCYT